MTFPQPEPESAPLALFQAWFAAATAAGVAMPEAMALATATPDARPSVRMVAEWELPSEWSLGVMPGVLWDENDNGERYTAGIAAITVGKGWTDRLRTFFELAGRELTSSKNGGSQVTWDTVRTYQPEVVILMPCGADVSKTLSELAYVQALPGWGDLPAVQNGRIYAVNAGAYFSRSGPRLVDGLELLAQIIQPELFPWTAPEDIAVRIQGPKVPQQVTA